jgi:hypothetical protein
MTRNRARQMSGRLSNEGGKTMADAELTGQLYRKLMEACRMQIRETPSISAVEIIYACAALIGEFAALTTQLEPQAERDKMRDDLQQVIGNHVGYFQEHPEAVSDWLRAKITRQ